MMNMTKYREIEFDPITYNILRTELKKKVSLSVPIAWDYSVYIKKPLTQSNRGGNTYHTFAWNPKTNKYNLLVEFQLLGGEWEAVIYGHRFIDIHLRLWE